ncbi:MAG: PKD domain-containing protein [Candidatus Aminicenantes bacterium]|nr:MAG: PKD domain-containing protein [Candidatus Aminicenantes bacterium]
MKKRLIPGVFLCAVLMAGLICGVFHSCKKQAFFADADAEIRISTDRLNIQLNESVRIAITGYNSDGSFLLDGTRVDLTIENGSLDRPWVELENGTASAMATANMERGEMKITARSGSAVAEPNPLVIQVGQVPEVNRIAASLNPAVLPYNGGRVEIVVTVYDIYFQPIAGVTVVLEADTGTLDSRGAPLTTDQSGQVIDYLETTRECTVTIYAGSVNKTVTVTLEEEPEPNMKPVADFTYSPLDPVSDETVYFNASASYDEDGFIQQYTWDFGDGSTGIGKRTTHKFTVSEFQTRTFSVTLTVVDNQGAHDSFSQQITVNYK